MPLMRIAVAADDRTGVAEAVLEELRRRGHEPVVHGALSDAERDDWAWASEAAARDVAGGAADQGIVCCWTGTGASIAANKVPGVRAALCADAETAAARASGTTRACWRCRCAPRARRCSRRSSTHGSRASRAPTTMTWRTSATWTRSASASADLDLHRLRGRGVPRGV